MFYVPVPDTYLNELTNTEQVDLEKKLFSLQGFSGAIRSIATRIFVSFDEKARQLKVASEMFRDGCLAIEFPREEAASTLAFMKDSVVKDLGNDLTDLIYSAALVALVINQPSL